MFAEMVPLKKMKNAMIEDKMVKKIVIKTVKKLINVETKRKMKEKHVKHVLKI
jgi:hypothetical protein